MTLTINRERWRVRRGSLTPDVGPDGTLRPCDAEVRRPDKLVVIDRGVSLRRLGHVLADVVADLEARHRSGWR